MQSYLHQSQKSTVANCPPRSLVYAIPAAKFLPLILFHSNPNETIKQHAPVAIAIINTFRTDAL